MNADSKEEYTSAEVDKMGYVIPLGRGLGFTGGTKYFRGNKDNIEEKVRDVAIKVKGNNYFEIVESISYDHPRENLDENKDISYNILYTQGSQKIILSSKIDKILAREDSDNIKEIWNNLSDLNKDF